MNPPLLSFLDGIFAGLGYTFVLVIIAFIASCWDLAPFLAST